MGREVICPACREAAAEESKRAAVLRAKRASWAGESVPVRISGRASTIIREYGAANNLPFAESLDALLKASDYFKSMSVKWESVAPYKSHRRDKHTTETTSTATSTTTSTTETTENTQEAPQDVKTAQGVTSKPQEVKQATQAAQAAKQAGKVTTSTTAKKAAGKTSTSKGGKA